MEIRTLVPGRNLLQGECAGAGRRAGFKGIPRPAAVAVQMSQDAVHNAGLGNDGNDLHLGAARAQQNSKPRKRSSALLDKRLPVFPQISLLSNQRVFNIGS